MKSIQHLRGTQRELECLPFPIPDGELVIEKNDTGTTYLKVGDGKNYYHDLPYVNKKRIINSSSVIKLINGTVYNIQTVTSLKITIPTTLDSDFYAEINFISGRSPTALSLVGGTIYFTGDDTVSGELIPEPNTSYNLFVWRVGLKLQGVVRGVPNE